MANGYKYDLFTQSPWPIPASAVGKEWHGRHLTFHIYVVPNWYHLPNQAPSPKALPFMPIG
jgi:hypothetical protein